MSPSFVRGSLLGARSDPRPRRTELHRGDEDARGQPDAREVEGERTVCSGQRGQDKLQSNPRESARGQLRFVARPQEERSGARARSATSSYTSYLRGLAANAGGPWNSRLFKTRRRENAKIYDVVRSESAATMCAVVGRPLSTHASKTISSKSE